MKKQKISYTKIRKFLIRCIFNPRIDGPLAIISDVGNADFYETRAIEFIKEATKNPNENYNDTIIKAIRLLALAYETRQQCNQELFIQKKDQKL